MPFLGPLEWSERFGEGTPSLAGRPLLFSPELIRMDRAPDASLLPMADGSTVAQSQIVGPDAPAGRAPMRASFDLVLGSAEDLATLQLVEALAEPVLFVPGWWHLDAWRVAFAVPDQGTWRTSRRLANHFDLPAEASLDGTVLNPVVANPAPGEVVLPTDNTGPGGHNAEVLTAPLVGTVLTLRYPAEYSVVITRLGLTNSEANRLDARVDLEEHLPARFTLFGEAVSGEVVA